MPSPRPVKPSFSLVVALTATRSSAMPAISAILARMASRCGPIFGASQTTVMSIWAMRPPRALHALDRKLKEPVGGGPLPLWVAGREMRADVAVGERAEQRVGHRMQHDVGIGMAAQLLPVRDAHAAEHHVVAGGESVHVDAGAGAHVGKLGEMHGLGADEILRAGDFHIAGLAFENGNPHAGPFGERGVVGEIETALCGRAAMRVEQRREGEALRRLDGAQPVAVERLRDEATVIDRLDRIGDGERRHRRAGFLRRIDSARDQVRRRERAGRRRAPARCQALCAASASRPARTEAWRVAPPKAGGSTSSPSAAASKNSRSSGLITGCTRPTFGASTSINSVRRSMVSPPMSPELLRLSTAGAFAAPGGHDHNCHPGHAYFAPIFASILPLSLSAFRPCAVSPAKAISDAGHKQLFCSAALALQRKLAKL